MSTLLLHKNRFVRIASLLGAIALLVGITSSVSPRAAGSAPTSIVFKAVASCGGGNFTLSANGGAIATFAAPTTCTCSETVQSVTITDSAALSAVGAPGCTDFSLSNPSGIYLSWAKVTVNRLDGAETTCISNGNGGCQSEDANFCNGYNYGGSWGPGPRPDNDVDGQNNCVDTDMDNDGIANAADNCSLTPNPNQADSDGNGFGNACDPVDLDNDGIWNSSDNCPTVANPAQTDTDGDGTGDACQPQVVAVPWLGSEALPHQVTPGGSIILQAAALAPGGGSVSLASGSWDPGDGAGQIAINVSNPLNLELAHTYNGSVGQPFTATIRVVTSGGKTYTDTFKVVIASNSRETRVNMAIDKGLWNLHKTLTRTTTEGVASGFWTGQGFNLAGTASAVQAFEINNHRESGDATRDPYVQDVARGLAWIMGSANIQKLNSFGMQNGNNPDGNANGFGLWVNNNDHSSYIGGQVMDAIVASGTPDKVAVTGINPGVKGNTYKTIVQDLMDGYSWGMADNHGGWYYGFQDVNGENDTSASHWWAIGVLAAHTWNLDAPQWVKNIQLNTGVPLMQSYSAGSCVHSANGSNSDNGDGHFGYTNSRSWLWDNGTNTTAAGLVLLNADGVAQTNGRFTCASQFLADRYNTSMGNFYTMYQLTKAMRTARDGSGDTAPIANLNGSIDWYAGYADYLVTNQTAAGAFTSNGTAINTGDLASAWAIIILSPSLFELPPSAACSVSPATIGKFGGTVNFSAAASFHPDASATITGYAWNFGDGTPAGSGVSTSHAYAVPASFPTVRNATVTVTDSNGNSSTASCPVTIVNNNVPPAVTIAGPYTVCKGSPITLVGNATDEDGTIGSTAWDLNAPVNFSTIDATGNSVDATAFFAGKAVGTYDIGFRATDNDSAVSSIFSTVTVIAANDPSCNQAPVAVDDSAATLSGTPVTISVLTNDTDADHNALTIDGTTAASNGSIVVNGDGTITYTPNTGFAGTDTFTYTIGDGHGGSDTATVTVTVTKRAATLTAGSGTKVYGSADPVLTPTSSGFLGDITITQTARDGGENVGGYATHATATGATIANYDVTYSDGSFTITQLAATVTADSGTKVFGSADPTLGASSNGFLAADNITASFTGRDGGENVGSYATHATAAGAALGNYNVTYTDGALTITKADSTAAATGGAFTYDGTAHVGSCSFAGVNGEVLNGTLTYSSGAAPVAAGSYTVTCDFAGNANYNASTASAAITIAKTDAVCSVTGYTVTYDTAAHTAIVACTGVNGTSLTGLDLAASTHTNAGTYNDAWTFTDVTGNYNNTSGTVVDVIKKAPTKTTLAISTSLAAAGAPVTLTATVVSVLPGAGTPNGTVTFTEGANVIGTATLNAGGVATLTTTTLSNGPHTITATYSESTNFLSSASNTVSTLIYGFAAGGGTFVISDTNATMGKAVTFWGAQWEKKNVPTGGTSNASFKGFAMTPLVPTVGATFTSAPGNSVPQPSSVPEYIGIIVTSKVTKSGSNITGTIVKLVVVKVDAGYVADPGHAGTGTIVAFIQ